MKIDRFNIGKAEISRTSIQKTLEVIDSALAIGRPGYICVTNSRTAYLANKDVNFSVLQKQALLSVPDGMPLVWIAHNKGLKDVGRVSGRDLMDAIFKVSEKKEYSHYLYGSSTDSLNLMVDNLATTYPGIRISGFVSPPFQPLEKFDLDKLAEEVNRTEPTFFWCGLGAPKQEYLISKLQPRLNKTICIGVGLAFEYYAGTVKRSPAWINKLGIEWLFRLSQQPDKIGRAIKPLTWIFFKLIASLFNKQ